MSEKDTNSVSTGQSNGNEVNDGSNTLMPDPSSLIFQRKGTTQLDTSLNGGDEKKMRE